MTKCPGLPRTEVFPGCETFRVKSETVPGKLGYLVSIQRDLFASKHSWGRLRRGERQLNGHWCLDEHTAAKS